MMGLGHCLGLSFILNTFFVTTDAFAAGRWGHRRSQHSFAGRLPVDFGDFDDDGSGGSSTGAGAGGSHSSSSSRAGGGDSVDLASAKAAAAPDEESEVRTYQSTTELSVMYNEYSRLINSSLENEKAFETFKQQPAYMQILEHMTCEQGSMYYHTLIQDFPYLLDPALITELRKNIDLGSPKFVGEYSDIGAMSPTQLRYLKVVGDIGVLLGAPRGSLSAVQEVLSGIRIAEVGVGYGGQAHALLATAAGGAAGPIASYELYDLPEVEALADKYLSRLEIEGPKAWRKRNDPPITTTSSPSSSSSSTTDAPSDDTPTTTTTTTTTTTSTAAAAAAAATTTTSTTTTDPTPTTTYLDFTTGEALHSSQKYDYDLFVSNFALSELPRHLQSDYITKLSLRSRAGYVTFNTGIMCDSITSKEFVQLLQKNGLNVSVRAESPPTAIDNLIITWGGPTPPNPPLPQKNDLSSASSPSTEESLQARLAAVEAENAALQAKLAAAEAGTAALPPPSPPSPPPPPPLLRRKAQSAVQSVEIAFLWARFHAPQARRVLLAAALKPFLLAAAAVPVPPPPPPAGDAPKRERLSRRVSRTMARRLPGGEHAAKLWQGE